MSRTLRAVLGVLGVFAAPAAANAQAPSASASAPAAQSAKVEVLVIHATKEAGKGQVDDRIKLPLTKKPFSDYNTFKVVEAKTLDLEKGRAASYALPTGRTLRVTLKDITKEKRYAVDAAIDQPRKEEYLKLLEVNAAANEPFFVGGQSFRGGTLILALTIKP
jgi:hypothetical protein